MTKCSQGKIDESDIMTVISGKITQVRPFEGEYDISTHKGTVTISANSTVLMNLLYDAMRGRCNITITIEDDKE